MKALRRLCEALCCLIVLVPDSGAVDNAVLDSPFGFHPAKATTPDYTNNGFADAISLGVKWNRQGPYAYWNNIQPDTNTSVYDFTTLDRVWGTVPTNMAILVNVMPQPKAVDGGRCEPGSWAPVDEAAYQAFVGATVERYDGDGVQDMPGLTNAIRYWQVGNEPNYQEVRADFAVLQRITYQAIKAADSNAVVLIAGTGGANAAYNSKFDTLYVPILQALGGQYFDIFDFHWFGPADGAYRLIDKAVNSNALNHVRNRLVENGYAADMPIWITEMGTYSGMPAAELDSLQTEREHAADLFKRHVYALTQGVKKIFPAYGIVEGANNNNGYFDHTGLIYDGMWPDDLGLGVKKLAYYTYKKMTDTLEGSNWGSWQILHDGTDTDSIYLFKIEKNGEPLFMAWWDYYESGEYHTGDTVNLVMSALTGRCVRVSSVVPSATIGAEVASYSSAFLETNIPIIAAQAVVPLGEDPVFIELDRDGDGVSDIREGLLGTDPGCRDTDGDGATDGEEVRAGTSPLNRTDVFVMMTTDTGNGLARVRWQGKTPQNYQVLCGQDLQQWSNAPSGTGALEDSCRVATNDGILEYRSPVPLIDQRTFYRVRRVE